MDKYSVPLLTNSDMDINYHLVCNTEEKAEGIIE